MSITCQKCKKKPARLILYIVEDDPSKDDEIYFEGSEEEEWDGLIDKEMEVCRPCAQEIQRSMLGGVTMIKPIGKK